MTNRRDLSQPITLESEHVILTPVGELEAKRTFTITTTIIIAPRVRYIVLRTAIALALLSPSGGVSQLIVRARLMFRRLMFGRVMFLSWTVFRSFIYSKKSSPPSQRRQLQPYIHLFYAYTL
jgi:hypothetical protein